MVQDAFSQFDNARVTARLAARQEVNLLRMSANDPLAAAREKLSQARAGLSMAEKRHWTLVMEVLGREGGHQENGTDRAVREGWELMRAFVQITDQQKRDLLIVLACELAEATTT